MNSPLINVILFSVFWAIQIFASKLGFRAGAQVVPFTIQTGFITIMLLTIYVLIFKRDQLKQLTKNVIFSLLIANAIHNGLGSFLSNAGISLTSAVNVGFLIQFTTVTTSVLAWLFLKEKMPLSKVITIITIMIGTFLLITKGQLITPHIGDILILLACLSWSTGNILVKKLLNKNKVDSDLVSFLRPIAGVPVFFGFILFKQFYPPSTQIMLQATNIWNFNFFPYVFFNGLFAVLLWIFLNRTLKIASASYMTMMSSLTPVLVAILAIVILKETLIPIQWVGVFLISISGIATQLLKIEKH
ncbi:MAG: EamA family transporter [Patescibacteria group bacterium]